MNSIQQVYDVLCQWRDRFPNLRSISIFLEGDFMILRWEWHSPVSAIQLIPISNDVWKSKEFEEYLFETIERSYCKWEVGEE